MILIKTKARRKLYRCDFCGGTEGLSEYAAPYSAKGAARLEEGKGGVDCQWIDLCAVCAEKVQNRASQPFVTLEKGVWDHKGSAPFARHEQVPS